MHKTGLILDAESLNDLKNLSIKAEEANFHSVWSTELYRTSFQQLSPVSQVTSKIHLGTAVSLAFTRSPLITALTALDLDELSSERFILGLGSGAKYTNEKYHGISYGNPVKRIKECIEIIRHYISSAHKGNDYEFKGEFYNIKSKGYKRAFTPRREKIDIYLAGIGKNMIQAASEVADGYIGHVVCTLPYLKEIVIPSLDKGFDISEKSKQDFQTASIITCAVSDNIDKAVNDVKATIGFYATVKTYREPFLMHGFEKEINNIRSAYFNNDITSMINSVSDKMVDTFSVVGSDKECIEKINKYRDIIDLPILSVPHYYIDYKDVSDYQLNLIDLLKD